jgi:integrase
MSVRKSHRGKWMVHVRIRRPNGEIVEVRRVSPINTKRDAQRYEHELRELIMRGEVVADAPSSKRKPVKSQPERAPTFKEWAEVFVVDYPRVALLAPSTTDFYKQVCRDHLTPLLGSVRMDQLGTREFTRLRDVSLAQSYMPKTINNWLSVLCRAVRHYYKRRNEAAPYFEVGLLPVDPNPVDFWEADEYARIVASAGQLGPLELAIVLLLGDAGLRRSEVCALEWGHLQRGKRSAVVVQRAFSRGHFRPPKNKKIRTIPMTHRLREALDALPRHIRVPWVITNRNERDEVVHTEAHFVARAVGRAERAAGVRKRRDGLCHKLRRTYVTLLANEGVPARVIMELAGHEDLATTLKYMAVARGATDDAVAKLDALHAQHHHSTAKEAGSKTSS